MKKLASWEAIKELLKIIREGFISLQNNKVSKVTGKDLSTNDYTNQDKAKVDAIPDNPKYTDTVYNDTAIKKQINDGLAGLEASKQGKLTAGSNISINSSGTISATDTKYDLSPYAKSIEIKTKLSEMIEDSTHRTVTDSEKIAWNSKISSLSGQNISRSKTKGYNTSSTWMSLGSTRDLEDWIGDFDKRTRENRSAAQGKLDKSILQYTSGGVNYIGRFGVDETGPYIEEIQV